MSKNRLEKSTSPYLLQHKENPVHWWEWGDEALKEAKLQNKPILLSVGYAACHWCHVMAHESFEDEDTANLMNDLFINIKVDREQRPDIDGLYMAALHRLGERGGWPLTMFLTPDAKPFWGGTYFPKQEKYGMPAFTQVLKEISRIYCEEQEKVTHNADAILQDLTTVPVFSSTKDISEPVLREIAKKLITAIDTKHGGIKAVPKFPQIPLFKFLWRAGLRYNDDNILNAVKLTMTHICQGGIYDHLGGGFARYSTDERWLAPHFEKMLYDNAQILSLLTEIWKETQVPLFKERIFETVKWLEREMLIASSAFASALDADTEGVEGKFYVWSREEIEQILDEKEADLFCSAYDISLKGNWEGKNIPNRLLDLINYDEEETRIIQIAKQKLFVSRETRTRPACDDKILADWNGLLIGTLAKAGEAFDQKDWIKLAEKAFQFIADNLLTEKHPHHTWREGKVSAPAISTDYANMIAASLDLYHVTQNTQYLKQAELWTEILNKNFWKEDENYFTLASKETTDLLVQLKSAADEATPNANGTMVQNLSMLKVITGKSTYEEQALKILRQFTGQTINELMSHQSMLEGALSLLAPVSIVISLPKNIELPDNIAKTLNQLSLSQYVIKTLRFDQDNNIIFPKDFIADLKDKQPIDNQATVYICIGQTCSLPVTNMDDLESALKEYRQIN